MPSRNDVAAAIAAGRNDVLEIIRVCERAGVVQHAASYLEAGFTAAELEQRLTARRAQGLADDRAVAGSPTEPPIVAACRRLAAQTRLH